MVEEINRLAYAEKTPHPVIPYNQISEKSLFIINEVINREEGGWVLTSNKNDSDGGWTYAGITAPIFHAYCPNITRDVIENRSKYPKLSTTVVEIYYAEFYLPVMSANGNKFHINVPTSLQDCLYSACVNIGYGTAETILNSALAVKDLTAQRKEFLRLWVQHYVEWVKSNPSKLEFLGGAINRVFKYVDF